MGLNRYPIFGPLLMFGSGGIFVEVFQDVTFRLAPIGRNEARRMVREIKGYKLLQGFRGKPKGDIESVEKCLVEPVEHGHEPPGDRGTRHQPAPGARRGSRPLPPPTAG